MLALVMHLLVMLALIIHRLCLCIDWFDVLTIESLHFKKLFKNTLHCYGGKDIKKGIEGQLSL